ncbi:hypothetical protein L21SP2_2293 [Salinispira pacifica]|uniref:Uncharacterized protein n=1 Tax=Salinispira pacifica TaxID=1307761 RepID=V5WJ46_9SPIO|nr:hypothetical protein L21SP2_2293 [Salinispira pacifica]
MCLDEAMDRRITGRIVSISQSCLHPMLGKSCHAYRILA